MGNGDPWLGVSFRMGGINSYSSSLGCCGCSTPMLLVRKPGWVVAGHPKTSPPALLLAGG